jgi:hypothetical protein
MQPVKGGHCETKLLDKSQASQGLAVLGWLVTTQILSSMSTRSKNYRIRD